MLKTMFQWLSSPDGLDYICFILAIILLMVLTLWIMESADEALSPEQKRSLTNRLKAVTKSQDNWITDCRHIFSSILGKDIIHIKSYLISYIFFEFLFCFIIFRHYFAHPEQFGVFIVFSITTAYMPGYLSILIVRTILSLEWTRRCPILFIFAIIGAYLCVVPGFMVGFLVHLLAFLLAASVVLFESQIISVIAAIVSWPIANILFVSLLRGILGKHLSRIILVLSPLVLAFLYMILFTDSNDSGGGHNEEQNALLLHGKVNEINFPLVLAYYAPSVFVILYGLSSVGIYYLFSYVKQIPGLDLDNKPLYSIGKVMSLLVLLLGLLLPWQDLTLFISG